MDKQHRDQSSQILSEQLHALIHQYPNIFPQVFIDEYKKHAAGAGVDIRILDPKLFHAKLLLKCVTHVVQNLSQTGEFDLSKAIVIIINVATGQIMACIHIKKKLCNVVYHFTYFDYPRTTTYSFHRQFGMEFASLMCQKLDVLVVQTERGKYSIQGFLFWLHSFTQANRLALYQATVKIRQSPIVDVNHAWESFLLLCTLRAKYLVEKVDQIELHEECGALVLIQLNGASFVGIFQNEMGYIVRWCEY